MSGELISTFFSKNLLRRATVSEDEYHWIVDLESKANASDANYKINETRLIADKALRYAEDLAENYVEYVGEWRESP